jgi:diacylglycerol kinase
MKLPKKYVRYNPFKSVYYASLGVVEAFTRELNLVFQLVIGVGCIMVSILTGQREFVLVHVVMMGIVISIEMMNSAFETLCDVVKSEYDERIKVVKDMAAGSVLISSLVWLAIIIFEFVLIIW